MSTPSTMNPLPPTATRRPSSTRRLGRWIGAAVLPFTMACYSYRTVGVPSLRVGSDVQMHLTRDGSIELQPMLGPGVRQLNGQLQEVLGDSAVVVLLDDLVTSDNVTLPWRRGRVTIPTRLTDSIDQRTLDRRRTRIFAASATTVFVAVIVAAIKRAGYSGSSRSGPGSGPPE